MLLRRGEHRINFINFIYSNPAVVSVVLVTPFPANRQNGVVRRKPKPRQPQLLFTHGTCTLPPVSPACQCSSSPARAGPGEAACTSPGPWHCSSCCFSVSPSTAAKDSPASESVHGEGQKVLSQSKRSPQLGGGTRGSRSSCIAVPRDQREGLSEELGVVGASLGFAPWL